MSGRPEALFKLFSSLETLEGIGPKTARHFEALDIHAPRDLLYTLPYSVVDRTRRETIEGLSFPATVTVPVSIGAHKPPRTKGGAYRVTVNDAQTTFQLVFFHSRGDYWQRSLPQGSRKVVSGSVEVFDGMPQMVHPDFIVAEDQADQIPRYEPIYPLTAGITQKVMFKAVSSALAMLPDFEEWVDPEQKDRAQWPDVAEALQTAHRPQGQAYLAATAPARERLAYDELLAHQLTLALARSNARRKPGRESSGDGHLQSRALSLLPYNPTQAQRRAIDEINEDLASPRRMNRLLQGDVGAGKTLVALLALLRAVEAGGQGVLMAPTEILARQHFEGLHPLAEQTGVAMEILTGRDGGREREDKLAALATGKIQILVGTHAVFQKDVHFQDLRLAVVDEQHRFGVRQRLELGQKGAATDVLVMTATPIPRSLALAQYGDMDVSVLDEKPPGRQPIKTALVSAGRMEEVVDRLR